MIRSRNLFLWLVACFFLMTGFGAKASGTYARPGANVLGRYSNLQRGQFSVGVRADFAHFGEVRLFNGNSMSTGDVRLRSYGLFGEYGLSDRSAAYAFIPFVDNDSDANAGALARESGIGDMRFGYHWVMSRDLEQTTSVLGNFEVTVPGRGYDTTKLTAPGDNSVDFLLRFALRNRNVANTNIFYEFGVGGKLRAGTAPNQWLYDAELGYQLRDLGTVSVFLDSINAVDGYGLGSPEFMARGGDFAGLKVTTTRLGGKVNFNIGSVNAELYYARAIQFQNQSPFDYYGIALSGRF
jgi:hypothetical protein